MLATTWLFLLRVKDRAVVGSNLHTNFKLFGSGEYLALVLPDTTQISDSFDPVFPGPKARMFRMAFIKTNWSIFDTPTPGSDNVLWQPGFNT